MCVLPVSQVSYLSQFPVGVHFQRWTFYCTSKQPVGTLTTVLWYAGCSIDYLVNVYNTLYRQNPSYASITELFGCVIFCKNLG
jgi:hypothetical protein